MDSGTLQSIPGACNASFRQVPHRSGPTNHSRRDVGEAGLAGLNLSDQDLSRPGDPDTLGDGHFYPATLVRALATMWLFSGLRRSEIVRLRVGCIRWERLPTSSSEHPVCFLHVPVNKTGTALSKPVDSVVGRAVELWEQMRPPQPSSLDLKTGEQVHRLFSHRGRGISNHYINDVVIPLLCKKAAVPLNDARGRITSHRARATIASQLYNAKEPLSLFELQEWLGHSFSRINPALHKDNAHETGQVVQDAGYFARNLRAVAVLIDQDVIRHGSPPDEPWKLTIWVTATAPTIFSTSARIAWPALAATSTCPWSRVRHKASRRSRIYFG